MQYTDETLGLRRFKLITDDQDQIQKYLQVLEYKNISREDVELILNTMTINTGEDKAGDE